MSYNWEIKEGDSLPELEAQIREPSGDVADLGSVQSVEFRMAHVRTDTLLVATNATISDGATGRATYDLKTEDTGMEGLHAVEWRVTRSSGETYSYPQNGNQEVFIHEGVGRDLSSVSTPNGDYTVDSLTADSISTEQVSSPVINNVEYVDASETQAGIKDAVGANTRVVLKDGTFDVSSTIDIKESNVIIEGQGKGATVLNAVSGFNDHVIDEGGATPSNITIRDLTISGNGEDTGVGIRFAVGAGDNLTLRNVEINDMGNQAFHPVEADNVVVDNCDFRRSGGNGVVMGGNNHVIVNSLAVDNGQDGSQGFGFSVEGSVFQMSNLYAEGNLTQNYNIENGKNSHLTNFYSGPIASGSPGNSAVLVQDGSNNVTVSNGFVDEPNFQGVRVVANKRNQSSVTVSNVSVIGGGTNDGIVFRGTSTGNLHDAKAANCYVENANIGVGFVGGGGGLNIDPVVTGCTFKNCTTNIDRTNAERLLVDGRGYNSGDPSSTGVWNGNGREGVAVYDTSVARPYTEYQYIDGAWQSG